MNRQAPPGHGLKDEPSCYICGRKRSVCLRVHDLEEQYGVPDPHEFETAEEAEANRARSQLDARVGRRPHEAAHVPEGEQV